MSKITLVEQPRSPQRALFLLKKVGIVRFLKISISIRFNSGQNIPVTFNLPYPIIRIVSTYGMITMRSDGRNAIVAQKLEKPRSSFGDIVKWHIDKIIWNDERQEFITKK